MQFKGTRNMKWTHPLWFVQELLCVCVCAITNTRDGTAVEHTSVHFQKALYRKTKQQICGVLFFFFSFLFLMGSDEFCELKRDDKLKK